jgi:hypothetical protein
MVLESEETDHVRHQDVASFGQIVVSIMLFALRELTVFVMDIFHTYPESLAFFGYLE